MKAIQCPKCGKMNDGSTDFCIYCGTIYDEYRAEDDDFNIFTIGKGLNKKDIKLNPMPEQLSSKKNNYTKSRKKEKLTGWKTTWFTDTHEPVETVSR